MDDYAGLERAWRDLAAERDLDLRHVPCDAERSLLLLEDGGADREPTVALSAGVHGDEPAAPWALLSLLRDGLLDRRFSYRIWCCTNPTGFARGTRENADGFDVNRSYSPDGHSAATPEARAVEAHNGGMRFALNLDLHEDYEAAGFYCYEPLVADGAALGARVVRAIDDAGFPLQEFDAGYDLGYPPGAAHLRGLERGRVLPNVAEEVAHFGAGLPYSMYLLWTGTSARTMTMETPRTLPWGERIAMHRVAAVNAIAALAALGTAYAGTASRT
jgi:succinylglutamate desuccinylase/aspartoacylase family protein